MTQESRKSGTYPLKIRIAFGRKQKYYPTDIDLTEEDYSRVFGEKLRKKMKAFRLDLEAKEQKAVGIIKEITCFSSEAFERKCVVCTADRLNGFAAYGHTIQTLYKEGRVVNNASNCECSQKSILAFVKRSFLLTRYLLNADRARMK